MGLIGREQMMDRSPSREPALRVEGEGQKRAWANVGILAGLTLLAAALRFYRIGAWGFDSDEVFMLRDSIHLRPTNPRPLLYALNHYIIQPFLSLDEFSLRLLPAICGVLAVPAFYLASRRLIGTRAALFGAFFVAISGLLVYYSQFGRYWTLVFLLSCIYPYALYLGLRDGNGRLVALGSVTGVLAVLAHPVSVLLLGGLAAWALTVYSKRERLAQLWGRPNVRRGVVIAGILAVAIAFRFIPLLHGWTVAHDQLPQSEKGGEFLYHAPGRQGVRQISLLLAFVENLTLPLVLAGALGLYLLWRRDRPVGLLLACLLCVPIAFIVLVSTRTAVSTFYLVPAIPVLFMGAGVFLDRLTDTPSELRPRWLLAAAVAVMIVAAGAPTLVSQYRDGRRWDFRGAASWLDERLAPGDVVFSDQPWVTSYYLPERRVKRLVADSVMLSQAANGLREAGRGGVLWVVVPAPSHAFRTNAKINDLTGWMYGHCQLSATIGVGRLDFRQNFLQVFRCPAEMSGSAIHPGGGEPTSSPGA